MAKLYAKWFVLPHETLTDEDRMERVRDFDDRKAFEALYRRYKGPIMSYLNQMLTERGQAEEIFQEVFLKVYRHRESYEGTRAKFSTWIWQIARNSAIDRIRKKKEVLFDDSGEEGELRIHQVESPLDTAEAILIEQAKKEDIQHCLERLKSSQKEAIVLRILSELSYEEISRALNVSLSSVKSAIFRAKTSLIECVKRRQKLA